MTMWKRYFFSLMVLLLAPFAVYGGEYLIGEGDTILVSVWGEKDLSLTVKVRPDGKITLPAVGDVAASNMTAKALQTVLTGKLKGIVKNPVVTVTVTEITNNKVYIFGGGVKAGVYSLAQRTTLLQLLCQIEDAKKADLKRAYVQRDGKAVKTDFSKLFIQGDTTEDIAIEPNDVIFIPTNMDKNVYVMGAVITPKFIEFREGLTVMEAILEAGGFTKYASPNDTIIYRKGEDQKEVAIPVKIKKLTNDGDLKQNTKLKPGDYVVVKEGMF
jgi:polysaccharide export outer membrane protein